MDSDPHGLRSTWTRITWTPIPHELKNKCTPIGYLISFKITKQMVTYILLASGAILLIYRMIKNRNSNIKKITAAEALAVHASNESTFIDVRTPSEIAKGKLDGAIEANVTSIMFKKDIASLDKSKPYIVYCLSGMRSAKACKIMKKQGFTDLTNVSGGYMGMK